MSNVYHQRRKQLPMKKLQKCLSLLMALAMLLSCAGTLAEPAEAPAAVGLPQIGDVVYGFEAKEIRDFALVGAQAVLFEHPRTGAKLMYIANEDTNRVFDLTFLTRPTDNTGLPHVFEHSTLDGSKKYPSKALFFNLSYQTYNTYMNASTYSVMTTYPIASLSEAQLLKYADYYTDSCFNPMIMEDESIFREEAWRYRMASMDDPLTIEGTVYSEMLGATTLARMAGMNAYRAAFPGSAVGMDQGGDPDYIPDMTFESLKNYHNLFYHPSNCIAFLYGDFEDYTAFLKLLDDAFAPFEKADFKFEDSGYTPITEPVVTSLGFPMEAGTDTANQSEIKYYVVCSGLRADEQEELVMNTLTDLLVSDSSPLKQALKRALPTGKFSCYIDTTAPDDAIVFSASNVNEGDAEVFKATVDAALKDIAEKGFADDVVDAVMASLSLAIRLTSEDSDVGTNVIPEIAYSYATSSNPFNYFDYVEALSSLKDWNSQGLYKAGVEKWLINSQTTALVTTYPEPGQKEVKDAALAEKLAAVKAAMSEEELQAIIDTTNAAAEEEDTSAMVADLTAVTVSSLPEEMKIYDVTDETGDDEIRRISAKAGVEGIGRVAMFLDASGLPQESIHWFKLFTQLAGELNTANHTKEELDVLTARYLNSLELRISLLGQNDNFSPWLRMGWTGMDEDMATSYDLMYERVFETDYTDEHLAEKISAIKTALRSNINQNAYNIQLYRALAVNNALYRYYNYANFLEYYAFLEQVEAAMETTPEAVIAALTAIQQTLRNRYHAMVAFAGNEQSKAANDPLADAFLARLDCTPIEKAEYDLPVPAQREGLIVDQQVQFNGIVADYKNLGMEEYDASLDAISSLVSDIFLVPQLRDQYGVYAPWTGALTDGGVYLLTYRDPNVRETFAVYEGLAEQLRTLDVTQETLDGYIMSSYAAYAKSSGELTGAMNALINILNGDPQDLNVEYMRELKAVTPEAIKAAADMYQKLCENGIRSTAGSASAINANAELYDVILNPFNAQDPSKIELTDLPEEHPHYAAVRFVFENGLMAPKSEDTFGVDSEATVGDLCAPLYMLIGGGPNAPEEAHAFLASYELVPADSTVDTPLTNALSDKIIIDFVAAAFGAQLESDVTEETADVVMTRGELAEQITLLQNMLNAE